MSTDRELLSLAAKAAGLELVWHNWNGVPGDETYPHIIFSGEMMSWNPLQSDADALRLAGELLLSVSIDSGYTVVIDQHERTTYEAAHGLVATRRAIVRAAAEIGRGMASK